MIPDRGRSHAVLIGISAYADRRLPDVPAAANSLRAVERMLTESGGWTPDQITVLDNPEDCRQVIGLLRNLAKQTPDALLLYYVGHGLISEEQQLCLTMADTDVDHPDISGIEYARIRAALRDSPARVKIIILDCCFSGRAIQALSGDDPRHLTAVQGAFVIAASDSDRSAHVPPLERQAGACTSFTGELVDLIASGIPDEPGVLTLAATYLHLRRRLIERGLPEPNCSGTDTAAGYAFANNRAAPGPIARPTAEQASHWRPADRIPSWLRDFAATSRPGTPRDVSLGEANLRAFIGDQGHEPPTQRTLFDGTVSLPELAERLGLDRRGQRRLASHPALPRILATSGTTTDLGLTVRRLAARDPEMAALTPLMWRPARPTGPAALEAIAANDDYLLCQWQAQAGRVAVIYPCEHDWTRRPVRSRDYMHLAKALPHEPDTVLCLGHEYGYSGPDLTAVDAAHPDRYYTAEWQDLVGVLGQAVPWWPHALRQPDRMAEWLASAATSAAQYEVRTSCDIAALLDLAEAEPLNRQPDWPRYTWHRTSAIRPSPAAWAKSSM
ncbi:caspase domain-containing protein [Catenulispora yoronensis]